MTKQDFFKAVSNVMKELAVKEGYSFLGPNGSQNKPYDIGAFKGWNELAQELKLEDTCSHPEELVKMSTFSKREYIKGSSYAEKITDNYECGVCGVNLKPKTFEEVT